MKSFIDSYIMIILYFFVTQDCQHNTTGQQCNLCEDGFYGDGTAGTSTDCTQCACPSLDADNK